MALNGHHPKDLEYPLSERLCCKTRKLKGYEFFAKIRNRTQSLIRIVSVALPNSPMSLT